MVNRFRQSAARSRMASRMLLYAQTGERLLEQGGVDNQAATVGLHVFQFVEGTKEAELGGSVLFCFGEGASVRACPQDYRVFR